MPLHKHGPIFVFFRSIKHGEIKGNMILSLFCMEVSPLGSKHRCVLTFEQHPGLSACVDGGKKGLEPRCKLF